MGCSAQNTDFDTFIQGFSEDAVTGDTFDFTYQSPSQGEMHFGWDLPLTINGDEIEVSNYKRFDNPYCQAEFDQMSYTISFGGHQTEISFDVEESSRTNS